MTLAVDDDFARFVAARWGELEPVALRRDPRRGPRAAAHGGRPGRAARHWDDVVDDGSPTGAAARRGPRRGTRGARRPAGCGTGETPSRRPTGMGCEPAGNEETVAAVLTVLVGASPRDARRRRHGSCGASRRPRRRDLLGMPSAHVLAARAALQGRLCSRGPPRPGRRPAPLPTGGRWSATSRMPSSCCCATTTTRPTPPSSSVSDVGQVRRRSLVVGGRRPGRRDRRGVGRERGPRGGGIRGSGRDPGSR